jgi:uncharacterized cupredoxin-like copper-binding protein
MTRTTPRLGGAAVCLVLAAALASGAAPALAHGDKKHAPKPAVVKEQKPWGIAGEASAATRTRSFTMTDDMRFTPDRLEVQAGRDAAAGRSQPGQGDARVRHRHKAELDEHAALMVKFPDMEHDEPYMAHVPPGKTGEIVWTFNRAGEFDFACLIAGHYQAGMVGKITVAPRKEH